MPISEQTLNFPPLAMAAQPVRHRRVRLVMIESLNCCKSGALLWTAAYLVWPERINLPLAAYAVPLAAFFLVRLVMGPLLYWRRVACPPADIAGAALAGLSLSHSIGRGILAGLSSTQAVFHVTRRSGPSLPARRSAIEEFVLLLALLAAWVALLAQPGATDMAHSAWMILLGLQALPYGAAVACAWQSWRDARHATHRKTARTPLLSARTKAVRI